MALSSAAIAQAYADDGFIFPVEAIPATQAEAIRADLEAAEQAVAGDTQRRNLLRSYPDRLLPSFDDLIRSDSLIAAVKPVLGEDLMVWSAGLFIKEPNSPHIVTWHQDLTYWGLDHTDEVTAWVALSPATVASGCMRFIPGSFKQSLVPHVDTFDDQNLLSRGQEIAVEVNEDDAIDIELQTGQASIHHGHLFHSSGPNTTDDRRIGVAIRYIKPSMQQTTGDQSLVALVNGEDKFGHFTIAGSPRGVLHDDDFALCRQDTEIKRRVLYAGAEEAAGKRY